MPGATQSFIGPARGYTIFMPQGRMHHLLTVQTADGTYVVLACSGSPPDNSTTRRCTLSGTGPLLSALAGQFVSAYESFGSLAAILTAYLFLSPP